MTDRFYHMYRDTDQDGGYLAVIAKDDSRAILAARKLAREWKMGGFALYYNPPPSAVPFIVAEEFPDGQTLAER